jgi:hypothetical protein
MRLFYLGFQGCAVGLAEKHRQRPPVKSVLLLPVGADFNSSTLYNPLQR